MNRPQRNERIASYRVLSLGFTLIEMIVTITVMAIVFIAITSFVARGVEGYVDTVDRERLQQQGRFVVEKVSREVRSAVPNSFNTQLNLSATNKCLTFYSIAFSGFYEWPGNGTDLDFIIGQAGAVLGAGDRLVINPSRYDDLLAASTSNHDVSNLSPVSGVFTLSNVSLASTSVAQRHFIYNGNAQVQYCISRTQTNSDVAILTRNGDIVADSLNFSQSNFQFVQASLQRGGLVHLNLLFEQNGEQSAYKHDVQVLNVP
ncbi:PilW family protein [Vibrio splendidus]|uniref:PilW family protein n=1 Tax=Vibrio splendidus TaxID=29497 RepID=UPI000CC02AF9|nr:type II secretion system protein [Vibrio splendidus]PMI52658.1 hypothetical protein BCU42_02905 [Vibrio splendidus]